MRGQNYLRNLRGSMGELLRTEFWSILPTFGFDALAQYGSGLDSAAATLMMAGAITVFGESILRSNDKQQLISRFIAAFLPPAIQRPFQIILEELIEEGAKRQNQFSGTPAENKIKAREILQAALRSASGKLGQTMPQPNPSPNPPTGAQPAAAPAVAPAVAAVAAAPAVAAAAAPPAPRALEDSDSKKTILQIVGGLPRAEQQKFQALISNVQAHLLTSPPDAPFTAVEFQRRLSRMTMPKAELLLFINGVELGPPPVIDGLQRSLFLQALNQSLSAGGLAGGFARLWDRAQSTAESLVPSGGNVATTGRELEATARRLKAEDDDIGRFR